MDPLYLRKLRIDRQIQRQMQNLNNNEKNGSATGAGANTAATSGEVVGKAPELMNNQVKEQELVKNIRDEVMTPRRQRKYNYIASMERSDYVKKMMNLPRTLPELLIQLQRPHYGKNINNVLNYQVPQPSQPPQSEVRPGEFQRPNPENRPLTPENRPVLPENRPAPNMPQQPIIDGKPFPQPLPPHQDGQPQPPVNLPPHQPANPQPQPNHPAQPQPMPQQPHQPQPLPPHHHEPMPLPDNTDNRPVPPNNVIPPRTEYLEGKVELYRPQPPHHHHHHGPQAPQVPQVPHEPHRPQNPNNPNNPNLPPNPNNGNRPVLPQPPHQPSQPMPPHARPQPPIADFSPHHHEPMLQPQPLHQPLQPMPPLRPELRPEPPHHKPHIDHHPSEEVGAVKDTTIDDAQAMLYTQLSMNDIANPTLTQMRQRLTDDAFELLFTGMLNLNDLSETIKHSGKDARSKLILAMANASKQGVDNSQISGSLKMVSESMAMEENNPASILKNIILLYLPWYPLQEGVGFKLAIETVPNMSDFSSLLKVFIQTRNYGNVNGSLILMNANNVDMQIQCDDKFPKDDLLERMKEVTVNHTINSNITVEQRAQMEQEVQNQQAKVNLSSTYDLNPFLLLMAHSFIKNTIIIDGAANV